MRMFLTLNKLLILGLCFILAACSFNPFYPNNRTTGNPGAALLGAGAGAGIVGLLGGSKPVMLLAGIGGGALGYYLTTLRNDASGIYQAHGQVYQVGQFIGIYLPTDELFDANTAEFLPGFHYALDSVVNVLSRYPNNNIIISGNTSGFARSHWEIKLSTARARAIADYLWAAGINHFKYRDNDMRQLSYVGYGNYFPIASDVTNRGIRDNSRIQITSYPSNVDLHLDKRHVVMRNIGSLEDDVSKSPKGPDCVPGDYKGECVNK